MKFVLMIPMHTITNTSRLVAALLSGLAFLPPAFSAPPVDEPVHLEDYLQAAAVRNAGLQSAFERWKSELSRVAADRQLPNPEFSYAYFIEEVETRVGPQKQRFSVTQALPWFGTRAARAAAREAGASAAYQSYASMRNDLFYEVTRRVVEYDYLRRALEVSEETQKLVQGLEQVAQSRHRTGAPLSDVLKLQNELSRLETLIESMRDQRHPLSATLRSLLHQTREASVLPWPELEDVAGGLLPEDSDSLSADLNPDLQAAEARIEQQEQKLRAARKAGMPRVMVGVDYIDTGEAINPDMADSGKDPLIARVAIDLPIWRRGINADIDAAAHERDAAVSSFENRTDQLTQEFQQARFAYREAERNVRLYQDSLIPRSRQILEITEEGYRTGQQEFFELIEAERSLLQYRLDGERARTDRLIAAARLRQLSNSFPTHLTDIDSTKENP